MTQREAPGSSAPAGGAPPGPGPESAAPVGRHFGNYQILSLLGKGGMAEVYRARVVEGPQEGWEVALKRLHPHLGRDPQSVQLFATEAELSRVLEHPNIVKVLEVGSNAGVYFMAMELVDGRDLGHILRRCRDRAIPLPIDFAVFLGRTLLDALAYAHSVTGPDGHPLRLVHCDVSPSNLFISRTGEIKLGDFGVARVRAGPLTPTLDGEADVLGKPFYVSPEALVGEVSQPADLWAANVVLYECLTLTRPFSGKDPMEVFRAIRDRSYRPARELRPEIPPALEAVIERAFAAKPGDRFTSAAEFAQALAPLYDERIGTPLAIAAVVRGLFGAEARRPAAP